jgi:uncharacterized protein YbaP (TraB family)
MKIRLLSLAFVFATTAVAQSSVWTAMKGDRVVYLGGTCHMLRPSDFPLPPEFDQAYAAAESVYFETDLEAMSSPEVQMDILAQGMFADGGTLQDVLSDETWQAITGYCENNGLPLEAFAQMKPWMFALTLGVLEQQKLGMAEEGVDLIYHKQAKEDGKPTHGLESVEHHIGFLTSLADGQEDELILSTLQDLEEAPQLIDDLVAAWRAGDLEGIDSLFLAEMREEFPRIYHDLIVGRNEAWLPQIEALFETPEVELVLAGVGHFAGPDSLLDALREAGCEITQIDGSE